MKDRWTSLALVLGVSALLLSGCATAQAKPTATPAAADGGSAGLPNPAAAYCQQQGYGHVIRAAADGGQQGFCIFPDGSECEEWAFFRGECKPGGSKPTPAPEADPGGQAVEGWAGTVLKQEPGDQLGPYFQREDGQRFGIGSSNPTLSAQIAGLRGSGTRIKVWGKLFTGVPADQARHIEVERLEAVN